MTLEDLGYSKSLEDYRTANHLENYEVGRVVVEHRERYVVRSGKGEVVAELLGNLRFKARSRADLPSVGDWVAFSEFDEDKGLIHAVFPRTGVIERQMVGRESAKQIIATNIDMGLIVQSVGRDFNLNRLERYLTLCNAASVEPVIIINKIDLSSSTEQLESLLHELNERIPGVPIILSSNETGEGQKEIKSLIKKGRTYCLLGSSGVGKSTLLNALAGTRLMETGEISIGIDRGKHVTTHRELFVLPDGGIVIDNPGMREVGVVDSSEGVERTFDAIAELARECRFKDCQHNGEKGCAVQAALEEGDIDAAAIANYHKILREKSHYETSEADRRRKDKSLGKMYKRIQEKRRKDKY